MLDLALTATMIARLRSAAEGGHRLARYAQAACVLYSAALRTEADGLGDDAAAGRRALLTEVELSLASGEGRLRRAAVELLRSRGELRAALGGVDFTRAETARALFEQAVCLYGGGAGTQFDFRFTLAVVLIAELLVAEADAAGRSGYMPEGYKVLFDDLDLGDVLEFRDELLSPTRLLPRAA